MHRCVIVAVAAVALAAGCRKETPAAQPPAPAAERAPTPAEPDLAGEYRRAAEGITFPYTPHARPEGFEEYCRQRLAAGKPIGVEPAMATDGSWTLSHTLARRLAVWRDRLSPPARDEYARRCVALARQVSAGEVRPGRLATDTADPLGLYSTAYNMAADPDSRARAAGMFYAEATRAHRETTAEYRLQRLEHRDWVLMAPTRPALLHWGWLFNPRSAPGGSAVVPDPRGMWD